MKPKLSGFSSQFFFNLIGPLAALLDGALRLAGGLRDIVHDADEVVGQESLDGRVAEHAVDVLRETVLADVQGAT